MRLAVGTWTRQRRASCGHVHLIVREIGVMKRSAFCIAVAGAVVSAALPALAANSSDGALGNGSRVGLPLHCDSHHILLDNKCLLILCLAPKVVFNRRCVAPCPPGEQHTQPNGACAPSQAPPR